MPLPPAPLACALLLPLALATAATAQATGATIIAEAGPLAQPVGDQTRFAAIAAEQARKAGESTPDVPSTAERWATAVRRELLTEPSGFYRTSAASTAVVASRLAADTGSSSATARTGTSKVSTRERITSFSSSAPTPGLTRGPRRGAA